MFTATLSRGCITSSVKKAIATELELSIDSEFIGDDELLNSDLLKVNSLIFVKVMISLEEELGMMLPDDLFVKHSFNTVSDIINVIYSCSEFVR